jgi:hypothetical protein
MPPRRRTRLGPQIDISRMARGLARPGADTRHWVSYATVAAIDDDGEIDLSNPNALVISPGGIDVDVVLEPSGYPMTCTYGQAAAAFFFAGPLRVGDQVLVEIPDGDASMIGRIVGPTSGPNGAADVIPIGPDGKPLFQNDRVLLMSKGVPIELRTSAGQSLLLNPDGSIQIGGKDATQQLVLGTTYRGQEGTMNQNIITALSTFSAAVEAMTPVDIAIITGLAATVGAMLTAFKVFAPVWLAALQAFESGSDAYLSAKNKTK